VLLLEVVAVTCRASASIEHQRIRTGCVTGSATYIKSMKLNCFFFTCDSAACLNTKASAVWEDYMASGNKQTIAAVCTARSGSNCLGFIVMSVVSLLRSL
jgi:hypothetical protein